MLLLVSMVGHLSFWDCAVVIRVIRVRSFAHSTILLRSPGLKIRAFWGNLPFTFYTHSLDKESRAIWPWQASKSMVESEVELRVWVTWILVYKMSPLLQENCSCANSVVKIWEKFGNWVYETFRYRMLQGGSGQTDSCRMNRSSQRQEGKGHFKER